MKILLLADHMDSGGAETHIYELSRFLSQKGHSVIVFSQGGRIAEAMAMNGIRQVGYGKSPLFKLASLIRSEKPNVIHAHTRKSAFLCRLLLGIMDFPFVFTAHAYFSAELPKRVLSFFPSKTIAVSRDIACHLSNRFGVPASHISVIENGINIDKFRPKRDKTSKNHIVMVSRLDEDCSLAAELLCQITPRLAATFEDIRITIVGGGNAQKNILNFATRANALCGREVIRVVGKKQDVLPYLRQASLFVGVSRAALEAMSCGLPVILCGNEGYLGILTKKTISSAEHGNFCGRGSAAPTPALLYRDICLLLKDRSLADRSARDGRAQVLLCHTSEQMGKKTLAIYHAAIRDALAQRTSDILICGYYGFGNLGDELTLNAIHAQLQKTATEYSLPRNPRFSVLAPHNISYQGLSTVERMSPIKLLSAIRHTGLLVFGGGSLLQNKTSNRSLFYYLLLLRAAYFFGVRTMLYGAGIGPIHGSLALRLCARTLRHVDLITVRDSDSLDFLKHMGVGEKLILSADPVLSYRLPTQKPRPYVLAFVKKQEAERIFYRLKQEATPIYLALMDRKSDLSATRRLYAKLLEEGKNVTLFEQASAQEIIALIGKASLVISARLHALILSFCMGVPFLGISDDPKITAFSNFAYEGLSAPISRLQLKASFHQKKQKNEILPSLDAKKASKLAFHSPLFEKGLTKKRESSII